MRVLERRDVAPAAWDAVCDGSHSAWLFHRSDWIDIERAHHRMEDHSFALADGDDVVAVQPLYLSSAPGGPGFIERLLHSGLHRHTGLALPRSADDGAVNAVRTAAMQRIVETADRLSVDRIQLNAHNLAPDMLDERRQDIPFWVRDFGFQLGVSFGPDCMLPAPGLSTCNADQIVDLRLPEEALFAALESACRRAVRKAASFGLAFAVERQPSAVERYYALAKLSAERTGEALPSIDYYRAVVTAFAAGGRALLAFARHDGRDVAALLLLIEKGSANFLAGVSDPAALAMRVNDFAHWSAMQHLKAAGVQRYRLGPIFPEVPKDWSIARVSAFKGKFGGASRPVVQGSLFRHPDKYRNTALYLADLACGRPG